MRNRKAGFTLIELLVVLAIITIISSITFGAFRSVTEGNQRTTCQSNMAQIYKSVRLYSQDFDGKFPYFNPVKIPVTTPATIPGTTDYVAEATVTTPDGGIGLWGLYTFRFAADTICPNNDVSLPLADDGTEVGLTGYVRSSKIFHCPSDRFEKTVQYRPFDPSTKTLSATCVATSKPVINAQISFVDSNQKRLNPSYLSYQTNDDLDTTLNGGAPAMTYSSFRREETVMGTQTRVRQLTAFDKPAPNTTSVVDRPMDQTTIITWCRFHRSMSIKDDPNGLTVVGKRNFDNVLFSDGSVQSLPMEQEVTEKSTSSTNGTTKICTGWQRVRRDRADEVSVASTCTP